MTRDEVYFESLLARLDAQREAEMVEIDRQLAARETTRRHRQSLLDDVSFRQDRWDEAAEIA